MRKALFIWAVTCSTLFVLKAQTTDPQFTSWVFNTGGAKASYEKEQGASTVVVNLTDSSDVKRLYYTDNDIYVTTEGLASYQMGTWPIPNEPSAKGYVFRIPREPQQETGTKTGVPEGGAIGVAVNGVPFYGYESAESWNGSSNDFGGDDIWNSDAWVNEGNTMDDTGGGHPTEQGNYHYHATPFALYSVTNEGHSPIIGWAPDGYPIYGPFGYEDPTDATSTVVRMESGYALRSITQRHRLPGETTDLIPSQWGPDVSATYPLGTYVEDYEYVGNGHLDEYNGRECVTPEYPDGTYAYFITVDESSEPAFPYLLASEYYGIASVLGIGNETIPTGAILYENETVSVMSDITNLSPDNADEGTASVTVTFSFDGSVDPPTPPANVVPNDVTLGGISGTSISRDGTSGDITATFAIASLTTDTYDIVVTFQPPTGDPIIYTGSNVFTINGSAAEIINIVDLTPDNAEQGSTSVAVTFAFEGGTTGPTTNFNRAPDAITIGGVSGTGISRNNATGVIGATFDLSSLAVGMYDLVVTFNLPSDDKMFTGTDLFEVTSGGSTGGGSTGGSYVIGGHDLEAWKYNKYDEIYTNTSLDDILVNVAHVHYDDDYVYISSSGIPDYYMDGETKFDAQDQNWVYFMPLNPSEETGTKTEASVSLGLFIDGTIALGPEDGQSYNNDGIWNQLAYEFEGLDFDGTNGHSTAMNIYHHHVAHQDLYDFDDTEHSPIVGYAFDGYPIYGPFGYADPLDDASGIARMESSYGTRNITDRTTLPDGTALSPSQYGPSLASQPLGKYVEDYEYKGTGDLDEYNGRWCITPEFPGGTYAYFLTVDATNDPVYPYILGESFYGDVETGNFGPSGGNKTIPGAAVEYISFLSDPEDVSANTGESAQFTAEFNGTPDTYQWYVSSDNGSSWSPITDGATYSGATDETLTIGSVDASLYGNQYKAIITGTNATKESSSATLNSAITGIVDAFESKTAKVYPNPFSADFSIIAEGEYMVKVYDLSGTLKYDGSHKGKAVISANWMPGVYIVEIAGEGFTKVLRLIKL